MLPEALNQRVKPNLAGHEADLCLVFAEYQLKELDGTQNINRSLETA